VGAVVEEADDDDDDDDVDDVDDDDDDDDDVAVGRARCGDVGADLPPLPPVDKVEGC
jgi:hypothetical protein